MDPPCSTRVSRARVYSSPHQLPVTGLSPSSARHSNASSFRWLIRVRSPLLTESLLLSFPVGTKMFQFPTFALHTYTFNVKYPFGWVAPFRHLEITARLPAPSSFSQVPTSFIASRHQDIHHVPLSLDHANRTPRIAPEVFRPHRSPRHQVDLTPIRSKVADRPETNARPTRVGTTIRASGSTYHIQNHQSFRARSDDPGLAILRAANRCYFNRIAASLAPRPATPAKPER